MSLRSLLTCIVFLIAHHAAQAELWEEVEHHFADSDGVKIHYVSVGKGPLVVMIHGFPDFWYSWRHQMSGLQSDFKVIAIDQRGYNKSDQPDGTAQYAMPLLVSDVAAVIADAGAEKATIVGHDWGGAVAWQFAFTHPEQTERLIVMNLPHPAGMARELANNPEQQANSGYAQRFRAGKASDPDILFGGPMTAEALAGWVQDPDAQKRYQVAFSRSSFDGMLNYYKANYPKIPKPGAPTPPAPPRLLMPTLIFHGLDDRALHSDGLNNTWDWIDADLTIVTAPGAGHFVQHDAAELVTTTMQWWLKSRIR